MKKETPILFSTEMVKALLDSRKTMTRRMIKTKYGGEPVSTVKNPGSDDIYVAFSRPDNSQLIEAVKCPYGKVGDLLWVREEHYRFGYWLKNGTTKNGNQKWMFKAISDEVRFSDNLPNDINHTVKISRDKKTPGAATWYKRLARFMPKAAARIWLEVIYIRIERLQEISNEDCVKEGVLFIENETSFGYKLYGNHHISDILGRKAATGTEFESFQTLFQHINGIESWDANPWVWVVSFKVIGKTGKL